MNVLLLKDVPQVGFAGQVVRVKEGYARNFLFPQHLARSAKQTDVSAAREQVQKKKFDIAAAGNRTSMLAENIRHLNIVLKEKCNDQGKLYGAVGADEIVELLKEKNIAINRKQVEFGKAIRTTGEYKVTIRLSSKLKPELTLKVVATS